MLLCDITVQAGWIASELNSAGASARQRLLARPVPFVKRTRSRASLDCVLHVILEVMC